MLFPDDQELNESSIHTCKTRECGSNCLRFLISYSCTYEMIQGPLPVSNYLATVRLLPITDGNRTFAEYLVEFDCASEQETELKTLLSKTYQGAFDNLKQHLHQP